jgi:hypothetical protein
MLNVPFRWVIVVDEAPTDETPAGADVVRAEAIEAGEAIEI